MSIRKYLLNISHFVLTVYQDMEIFYFLIFLTMQLYFPTNCFQFLPVESLERDKFRTVGIFAISQLVHELYAKEEFLFLTVF